MTVNPHFCCMLNSLTLLDVEKVEETSHHEHLLDVFVDVLNGDASTLG